METIEYKEGKIEAHITVRKASVLDGMRRGQLIEQAIQQPDEDPLRQTARIVIYPEIISATLTADIYKDGVELPWPLPFDELIALPEDLVNPWLEAVYELNPAWSEQFTPEKKVSTPSSED